MHKNEHWTGLAEGKDSGFTTATGPRRDSPPWPDPWGLLSAEPLLARTGRWHLSPSLCLTSYMVSCPRPVLSVPAAFFTHWVLSCRAGPRSGHDREEQQLGRYLCPVPPLARGPRLCHAPVPAVRTSIGHIASPPSLSRLYFLLLSLYTFLINSIWQTSIAILIFSKIATELLLYVRYIRCCHLILKA